MSEFTSPGYPTDNVKCRWCCNTDTRYEPRFGYAYCADHQDTPPNTPIPTMTIHRVRLIDVDGGRIGRTWSEEFFYTEFDADQHMMTTVREANDSEEKRGRDVRYKPDTVAGVYGWCNWQYGNMYTTDKIEVTQ